MNKETEELAHRVVDAIQDKKGRGITIVDLSDIAGAVCPCFVICQGNSPTQLDAIARQVGDRLRLEAGVKPIAAEGLRAARWIALDYVDVMVHIFLPEVRSFYNLEGLWADAALTEVPDLD